ncbi:sensor histidine kinase KdpD [Streptomyces sp. VRA16 Mangrove soil]|uniref:sensor histidine kinase n=1 Tax=Streptomyces sp. VRA16 Mangrove soil TaxID=2817434 RepID=UPI001A9FD7DF|nr:ATP-binding protein [Streptomyces sp. VRA16 Mangrove soil]MBO1329915.1 sensor histidine kinase [Streptomyces sp. VRA16 Mangrove soil]
MRDHAPGQPAAPPPGPQRPRPSGAGARVGLVPAATATVLAASGYGVALAGWSPAGVLGAGICAAVGCTAALTGGWVGARRAQARELLERSRDREQQDAVIRQLAQRLDSGIGELTALAERVRRDEQVTQAAPPAAVPTGPEPLDQLGRAVQQTLYAGHAAVVAAGTRQQVDAFVSIARKLQALVTRSLERLDGVEREVEDPELLDALFQIDHLITRVHRAVENIAILGGAVPRHINSPVPLATLLRQAVAETEHFARVRVIRPPAGYLVVGHAAAEAIHLVAELAENATRYSPPDTQVSIRPQAVAAGIAVEIDDRGLGLTGDQTAQLNRLLADPEHIDVNQQLRDGRTGLLVAARIARRRGLTVRLQSNVYGGTQAVVLFPHAVLHQEQPAPAAEQPRHHPAPAQAAEPPTPIAAPAAWGAAPAPSPAYAPEPGPVPVPVPVPDPAPAHVPVPRPRQELPQRPSRVRQVPAAAPLPAPAADERPPLAQRAAHGSYLAPELRAATPGQPLPAEDPAAPHGPVTDLWQRYSQGYRQATEPAAATSRHALPAVSPMTPPASPTSQES